jgi:pyruvate-formate lyase-activating enzyme
MMRVGTHKLRVETGRWANEPLQQRICKVCTADKIEDELHVVVECQVYATEREELLARVQDIVGYDLKPMNNDALLEVLLGIDPLHEETGNLVHAEVAKYLTKALRIRDSVLNNLKDSNEDDTHDSDCIDDRGESGDEM